MGTILLIILILLLIGALPAWPYSSGWGYWPSGGLGLIVLIIVILALTRASLSRSPGSFAPMVPNLLAMADHLPV